jgi:CheY-like chemotaxis protein
LHLCRFSEQKITTAKVLEAANGSLAVASFRENRPDLIFMDVQMPIMDGVAATLAIREMEKLAGLPPVPIVALTAGALIEEREKCFQAGMDDFLTKPVESEKIRSTLVKYLN